jgi:hypothetical protein
MVDINLFDDEPEDEKQENDDQSFDNLDTGEDLDLGDDLTDDLESDFNTSGGDDDLGGFQDDEEAGGGEDSIDEALGFDEEFSKEQELEPDDLMEEEFTELDDEAELDSDDYDYGGGGHKQVTPLIWVIVFLAVVVIAFVFYRDPIMALFTSKTKLATKTKITQTTPPKTQITPGSQTTSGSGSAVPADTSARSSAAAMQGVAAPLLNVSVRLFDELSSKGQFNMMMVDNDRFAVEYVADVRGSSASFAQRVKTLVNATAVVASPEDAHSVNGKMVYFGVISGKLDPDMMKRKYSGPVFSDETRFINAIKSQIQQYGLKESGYLKRSSRQEGSQTKSNYEFVIEGDRIKAITFIKSLNSVQGAWEPVKIRLSPVNLNDFSAQQVKLVLDLAAFTGSASLSSAQPGS